MPCSFFLLTTFTDGLIFISLILWLCYFQAWKLHNCKIWLWLANWLQPPFTAQHRLQQAVATKQCAHRRFQYTYLISSYSFRGNYSFFKFENCSQFKYSCCNVNVSIFYLINWIFAAETIQGEEIHLRRKLYEEIRYLHFTFPINKKQLLFPEISHSTQT